MTQLDMTSLADGVRKYAATWFGLDQRYRKFIYHLRESGQASLLGQLATRVENLYSTNYLTRFNDQWQQYVDAAPQWTVVSVPLQREFTNRHVQPFLERKAKGGVPIYAAFTHGQNGRPSVRERRSP